MRVGAPAADAGAHPSSVQLSADHAGHRVRASGTPAYAAPDAAATAPARRATSRAVARLISTVSATSGA